MALAHEFLAHPGLKLFPGVPAMTIAGQMAPYQRGGWHGHELADVIIRTAVDLCWDITRPAGKPYGALKTLLSQIDPIRDVVMESQPPPPEPCGRQDCDNGWIPVPISLDQVTDVLIQTATDLHWDSTRPAWKPTEALKTLLSPDRSDTGRIHLRSNAYAKCPDCHPAVRSRRINMDQLIEEPPW